MKKVLFAMIVAMAIYGRTTAQTNTFPNDGNVGIGTISPAGTLHINMDGGSGTLINQYGLYINRTTSSGTTANNLFGIYVPTLDWATGHATTTAYGIYIGNMYASTSYGLYLAGAGGTNRYGVYQTDNETTNYFAGKVGIGTTSPAYKLDLVGGDMSVSNAANNPQVRVVDGAIITKLQSQTVGGTAGALGTESNHDLNILTDNTARITTLSGGNVGIATTAPVSLFQVDDGCTKASIGDASGIALNYGTSYLGFNASRSISGWSTNADGINNGGGVIYSSIFGDMYFAAIPTTGGSGQALNDGNLVNNIALKISHTDGAVYAKQIYVQTTGWPDFVFKKDYALRPLSEVKSYIEQNQHLPDMPPAEKVEKDGVNLGEMNKALLKKIEELTLYLIEKDNENKALRSDVNEQKRVLECMEARLKTLETKQ